MPTLQLGVEDLPYATGETTSDVAAMLEAKYHIMETFQEVCVIDILDAIEGSALDALEAEMEGRPAPLYLKRQSEELIEDAFRKFLSLQRMDGYAPGVPTKASIKEDRASFVKTGKFEDSFRAWLE